MKTRLLYRGDDFDWQWALRAAAARDANRTGRWYRADKDFDRNSGMPWNENALTTDFSLDTLFHAMAQDDGCIFEVVRKLVLAGVSGDIDTIRYRQAILKDCLNYPAVVRGLYAIAGEALEKQRARYLGPLASYPDYVLRDSIDLMEKLIELLKQLDKIAYSHAHQFVSEGWTEFFAMLKRNLGDEYLAGVKPILEQLKFRNQHLLLSAELTAANKGDRYLLHQEPYSRWAWLKELFTQKSPAYSFRIHPRDDAGFRALAELRARGIGPVATALGLSADHVCDFFGMLRAELAFYVGCINLHEQLTRKGEPVCLPECVAAGERRLSFRGLYDVGLTLSVDRRVVGNDADADNKDLVIVTGANTGGKSTFLRSVGLAQLMMQCGMFVPATAFCSSLCDGLFTHYKREEDAGMESGKFDEELSRMSDIVDRIKPHSMVLLNESFAATNEREGSEIARQIITALLDTGVSVLCVTHLYELAHGFYEKSGGNALFLRAERQPGGSRSFKLVEGAPLETSYGEDLYVEIFGSA